MSLARLNKLRRIKVPIKVSLLKELDRGGCYITLLVRYANAMNGIQEEGAGNDDQ